jgi:hypothetical protein
LVTEYEALLKQMIDERKARLEGLRDQRGKEKAVEELRSDMRFIEVELERYQKGLALFRTKSVPKVGRWGKPEPGKESPGP